jgi:hypothetical protein
VPSKPRTRASASRYHDVRRRKGRRRLRPAFSAEAKIVRRALSALARADGRAFQNDYAPLEIVRLRGREKGSVVYVQQRYRGLPVYDGRRSVVLVAGRPARVTGRRLRVRELARPFPRKSAEAAVRAVLARVLTTGASLQPQRVAVSLGAEGFACFRVGGLPGPLTAHVVVFVVGGEPSRLAWVVHLATPGGQRFELLLDADSLRLLKQRSLAYHLEAGLNLDPPNAGAERLLAFPHAWTGPAGRVSCAYESSPWTPPAASAAGVIRGTDARDKRSLNAFCLASRGLDLLDAAGARIGTPSGAQLRVEIFGGARPHVGDAAVAYDDFFKLAAIGKGATFRHAARDPTVILHEMSHVVLGFNLGGASYPGPFENHGESGAAAEGLADFLGLTLWNRIQRELDTPQPSTWVVGASFLPASRDYVGWLTAPVPPAAAGATIQDEGRQLCGALVLALSRLMAGGRSEQQAEQSLWSAVCVGLQQTPHQGDLPLFCCIAEAVRTTIDPADRATVSTALGDAGLPTACPHWGV